MDAEQKIVRIFPFVEEIEKTEFYSGLLAFIPKGQPIDWDLISIDKNLWNSIIIIDDSVLSDNYNIWHKDAIVPLNEKK